MQLTCSILQRLKCLIFCRICVVADTLRIAAGRKLAVMIAKDIEEFPENSDRLTGTIDIWWIVRIFCLTRCDVT